MTLSVKDDGAEKRRGRRWSVGECSASARPPALIGYARVSTDEQNLALQQDALRQAACDRVFEDSGVSGVAPLRPGLDAALRTLAPGDTLVVWRLDRLGRSLLQLVSLIEKLAARDIGVRSLTESFDAGSSGGRLVFHLMAAMAEFERSLIAERTRAGLAAARARGSRLGRPPTFTDEQRKAALQLVRAGRPVGEVARVNGMHPRTVYRIIQAAAIRLR